MKTNKAFRLPSGTIVPAGTELHFSNEGQGFYNGEAIDKNKIPAVALEAKNAKRSFLGGAIRKANVANRVFKENFPDYVSMAFIDNTDDKLGPTGLIAIMFIWDTREVVKIIPLNVMRTVGPRNYARNSAKYGEGHVEPAKEIDYDVWDKWEWEQGRGYIANDNGAPLVLPAKYKIYEPIIRKREEFWRAKK